MTTTRRRDSGAVLWSVAALIVVIALIDAVAGRGVAVAVGVVLTVWWITMIAVRMTRRAYGGTIAGGRRGAPIRLSRGTYVVDDAVEARYGPTIRRLAPDSDRDR